MLCSVAGTLPSSWSGIAPGNKIVIVLKGNHLHGENAAVV